MTNNKPNTFGHLNNKPLRERIADMLRDLIIKGQLKPGDPIVETELAAQLGVSRAPLREALQILNTERLIEIVPYHKTMVRKLTRSDINELYSLRSVLEGFAMRRIIEMGDGGAADVLRQIVDQMVRLAERGDALKTSEYDHRFHDTIIEKSRHSLLISTWSTVSQRVHQVLALRDMVRSDIVMMANSHYVLVDALESGDVEQAQRLIEEHIMDARDLIIEVWDDGEPEAE